MGLKNGEPSPQTKTDKTKAVTKQKLKNPKLNKTFLEGKKGKHFSFLSSRTKRYAKKEKKKKGKKGQLTKYILKSSDSVKQMYLQDKFSVLESKSITAIFILS